MLLASVILFQLLGSFSSSNTISYDTFVKEFLMKGNVGSIKIYENGRVAVIPRAGDFSCCG